MISKLLRHLAAAVFLTVPVICVIHIFGVIGAIEGGDSLLRIFDTLPAFGIIGVYAYMAYRLERKLKNDYSKRYQKKEI